MLASRSLAIGVALLGLTAIAVLAADGNRTGWNSARDPVARYALAYIYERAARADDARVVISQPVSKRQLASVGLSISPDAGYPGDLHLVVITGDLDLAGLAPGWGRATGSDPRSYIAHVFDTTRTPSGDLMIGEYVFRAHASLDEGWPDWARQQLSVGS